MIDYPSETKQKTLEEIASAFGDRVILPEERDKHNVDGDGDGDVEGDDKPDSQRVDVAVPVPVKATD